MTRLPSDVINSPELLQLQAERETAMEELGAERFRRQLEQQSQYRDLSRRCVRALQAILKGPVGFDPDF